MAAMKEEPPDWDEEGAPSQAAPASQVPCSGAAGQEAGEDASAGEPDDKTVLSQFRGLTSEQAEAILDAVKSKAEAIIPSTPDDLSMFVDSIRGSLQSKNDFRAWLRMTLDSAGDSKADEITNLIVDRMRGLLYPSPAAPAGTGAAPPAPEPAFSAPAPVPHKAAPRAPAPRAQPPPRGLQAPLPPPRLAAPAAAPPGPQQAPPKPPPPLLSHKAAPWRTAPSTLVAAAAAAAQPRTPRAASGTVSAAASSGAPRGAAPRRAPTPPSRSPSPPVRSESAQPAGRPPPPPPPRRGGVAGEARGGGRRPGGGRGGHDDQHRRSRSPHQRRMTERDMDHMSRAFSRVLRYDAAKMGLAVEDGGFVRVLQLLEHFENYTFQDVRNLVSWSVHGRDGARFELRETPSGHLIRSTRGHTDVRRASSRPSSAHMSDEDMPARRHQDLPRRERSPRRAPWRRESNGEPFSLSLSKGMAKLLRHTDHEDMSPNGWLAMRTLIQMLSHGRTPVTAEDIRRVAEFNKYSEDRPRYEVHVAGRDEWVRAVRGHTVL